MGSFTDYLENELLDHVWGGADYSRPATLYVALSTTTIADDGTNQTEPSGGSYARVAVTNNSTNWPAASGGAKANGTAITFPTATAGWGTIVDFSIMDDPTAGNMLAYGTLTTSKTIDSGDTASFAIGDLDITLT
jgi:hypothetical protein